MKNVIDKLVAVNLKKDAEQLKVLSSRQTAAKIKIPVLGGIKAGKSSMLAKMLGVDETMFPKDVIEATAKNVNIQYGPFAMRSYTTSDARECAVLDDTEWNQLVCGKSSTDFEHLDIALPDALLKENDVVFVDTPGNNTVDDCKATETWNALANSQAGIYCLKATALMEGSDLRFIQEAKYYVDDFIFLVTRMDETGASSVYSETAKILVEAAKQRLKELGIHPLAVLPISSLAPRIEDSGIPELRQAIQKIIFEHGIRLRNHQVWLKGYKILEASRNEIDTALKLSKKALENNLDQFAEKKGCLEGRLIELDGDKKNAIRRLGEKMLNLEQRSCAELRSLSEQTMERVENRIRQMQSYSEIKESGDSVVRSELDKWRQDAQSILGQLPDKVSDIQIEVSKDFVAELQNSVQEVMGVNVTVPIAEIEDDLSVKTYADECLEELSKQREELINDIAELQEDLKSSDAVVPELEHKLSEAKEALQKLHYEPVYEKVEVPKSGIATSILKNVGALADIAMIFLPTGWVTGIGKVGVVGSKLPKIAKILNNGTNVARTSAKVVGTSNVLTAVKNQGKGSKKINPFEYLSLEFWGEKLGNLIDGVSGREPKFETIENQEVLAAYLQQKGELEAKQQEAQKAVDFLEIKMVEKNNTLNYLKNQNLQLDKQLTELQEDAKNARVELRNAKELSALITWKKSTLSNLNLLLYGKNSELVEPIRQAISQFFKTYSKEACSELSKRLDLTIQQLKEQLSQSMEFFSKEKSEQTQVVQMMNNQMNCLDEIIALPEKDWFEI